jgi:ubiquinone/menaquinone biosynthesis C-methylase UbiE
LLDNPVRALLLSPKILLDRLPIRPRDWILEVGPGPGFFSVELARRVPEGQVELLDIQPEMLAQARSKIAAAGLTNVGFTVADAGRPLPFPAASFDLALLVTVLGEVPNPDTALTALATVLRPAGILAIHEQFPDPDMITRARLKLLVEPCGFTLLSVIGPRWNYTAVFQRNGSRVAAASS